MTRRVLLLAAIVSAAMGCGPKAPVEKAGGEAPPLGTLLHGYWSGKASKSPLGVQPYAITFRSEGGNLVGETPPSIGEDVLPPGAYQKFVFQGGAAATKLDYKTAMGERGFLEGTLDLAADKSGQTKAVFCEPNACERFELRWEATGPKSISFQVWVDAQLHADIDLSFEGDM